MENNTSKRLTVLALILFIIFAGINFFWLITMYIPYCGYSSSLVQYINKHSAITEEQEKEKYFFHLSETTYLGYDYYLSVGVEIWDGAEGVVISGIYICPNIWGSYEYYVNCMENGNFHFMFEIDEYGNYIPYDENDTEFNEKAQQILNEKHSEVTQFIKTAKDCWGLEAKHDFKMGIKSFANITSVILVLILVGGFCLITATFIWLLKYKIPFQKYAGEMDAVNGMAEFNFKRIVGDYEFYMSKPRFLRNDGFLMIQKHQFSADRISLIICPRKKEITYFVFINDSKCLLRKANKIKLEYIKGKVISGDKFVLENNEEIEDLIIQASLFWGIE